MGTWPPPRWPPGTAPPSTSRGMSGRWGSRPGQDSSDGNEGLGWPFLGAWPRPVPLSCPVMYTALGSAGGAGKCPFTRLWGTGRAWHSHPKSGGLTEPPLAPRLVDGAQVRAGQLSAGWEVAVLDRAGPGAGTGGPSSDGGPPRAPHSHDAGAPELRHLPLRQLPAVPARLPPRPLVPVLGQERLHHQHCGVSLRGGPAGRQAAWRWARAGRARGRAGRARGCLLWLLRTWDGRPPASGC